MPSNEDSTAESTDTQDLINKSVVKAINLLRELGRHPRGVTVTDIAHKVGMTRPTAFRLLLSMEREGFVDRKDNLYTVGWDLLRLGRQTDLTFGMAARVQPYIEQLAEQLNEYTAFVLMKGELDYDIIAEAAAASRMLSVSAIHQRFPLHASAFGKIMLAELPDDRIAEILPAKLPHFTNETIMDRDTLLQELHAVRRQSYAVLDSELEEGLFAVAVGCYDADGRLFGALSATGPEQRMKTGKLPHILESLHTTADEISRILS
ncbi:IclR family transcriptional regulator [Arthrobacter crystallopoietes BAB-32]|uniref:IclR family transcriptional regulator n=1 Tax=Arthrobacter crystallopoietes BAB-32 TaxID=1246476 RepID=N1URG5_9MICC|nr:IclR family transcriptional regulator [Arthrobacter crystallopoietes]EMY33016.1 IclR family transcriptional regulator [Arthrobacter crystallopoietes BAB-32]